MARRSIEDAKGYADAASRASSAGNYLGAARLYQLAMLMLERGISDGSVSSVEAQDLMQALEFPGAPAARR